MGNVFYLCLSSRYFGRSDDGVSRQFLEMPAPGVRLAKRETSVQLDFGKAFFYASGIGLHVDRANTNPRLCCPVRFYDMIIFLYFECYRMQYGGVRRRK